MIFQQKCIGKSLLSKIEGIIPPQENEKSMIILYFHINYK